MCDLTYIQAQFIAYCFTKQKEMENGVDSKENQTMDVKDYMRHIKRGMQAGKEVEQGKYDHLFKPKRKMKT